MPKTVTKGNGITARTERVHTLIDRESVEEWKSSIPADAFQFFGVVKKLKAWAKEVKREAEQQQRVYAWDDDSPESYAWRLDHFIGIVHDCIKRGDANGAARFALEVGKLAEQARMKFAWEKPALRGVPFFRGGRGPDPIRRRIRRLLAKNPSMKNADLWDAISAKPPKKWKLYDSARLGKYIEGPKADDGMKYRQFCNHAWEERRALKR